MNTPSKPASGAIWRLLAHRENGDLELENEGLFDELTLEHWFHIEQMDEDLWWMRVGDARITVAVGPDGQPSVAVERGFYDDARGK
jgi:hypothetical protein